MSCKRLCSGRKNQLIEDSERLPRGLGIFLRAHHLLTSFIDFFKFRAAKCCGTNCDKIPLHGALDVAATAMASVVCGNVPKKESQRPGLFRDAFPCTRCKQEQDVPDNLVQKVDMILIHLQKSCPIENIICHIKNVLSILEELSSDTMSERLRMLYFFQKEIMKNLLCSGQTLTESLNDTDTKMILGLVNNFLRDWTEVRSPARPCLKVCRFCNQVVSKSSQEWGSFCCKEAHFFNVIWEEWALQQSISVSSKDEYIRPKSKLKSGPLPYTDEDYTTGYPSEPVAPPPSRTRYTDYDSADTRSTEVRKTRGLKDAPKHPSIDERFEGLKDRDSAKTKRQSPGGKARRSLYRNEYPIGADGRGERDDALYRGKPGKTRGSREEGTAVGKMRKIKRGAGDSRRDHTGKSRSESERRSDRSSKKKYRGARSTSDVEEIDRPHKGAGDMGPRKIKRSRLNKTMTVDDDGLDDSSRRRKTDRGRSRTRKAEFVKGDESTDRVTSRGRGKKSHRRVLSESERETDGWTNDTDDEGKTTRRKGRRKREEKTEEVTDISKSKEARGRRKKKGADALDSERKVSRGVDEEENVLKRDGKRKGRTGKKTVFDSSAEDKSTLESEGRSKKGTSARSKKGRRQRDSSRTDDDYSKINGSRYHKKKSNVGRLYDARGHPNPIEYQLSNQHFIQRGWTVLPVAKTMREIIHYRTEPAKPHLEWFERYKNCTDTYYSDGSIFLKFHAGKSGEVFYPNGNVAIRVEKQENREYDMYTVFTPGGKDCVGIERKSQIVAVFDTMGNGAVFDEDGGTRLSYNQVGGIWRDNPTGLPLIWKWNIDEKELLVGTVYEEKSTAHLEKFLSPPTKIKSSRAAKAPTSPASSRNKDKKVVESKPVVAVHDEEEEKVESGSDFHKMYLKETCSTSVICMKLNDFISLRILDRKNINLQFFAPGMRSIRIELGTILNRNKKVATYIVPSTSIATIYSCKFDNLALSDLKPDSSLYQLKQDLQLIAKTGKQRRGMIRRYHPNLRAWKKSKTRCRLE